MMTPGNWSGANQKVERSFCFVRQSGLDSGLIMNKSLPINIDKEIMSGQPVFMGTRVPVSALIDNLEVGVSLDEFLENFPTVQRRQAIQVLEYFKSSLDHLKLAA